MGDRTYQTAMGRILDMGSLYLKNEHVPAVGNMGVDASGKPIKKQRSKEQVTVQPKVNSKLAPVGRKQLPDTSTNAALNRLAVEAERERALRDAGVIDNRLHVNAVPPISEIVASPQGINVPLTGIIPATVSAASEDYLEPITEPEAGLSVLAEVPVDPLAVTLDTPVVESKLFDDTPVFAVGGLAAAKARVRAKKGDTDAGV